MSQEKFRPYWHLNAKWIFGIIFVIAFFFTLIFYNLSWLTREKPATDILATALAVSLSPKGLDDETEIKQMRQLIERTKTKTLKPIPGLDIEITLEDFSGDSPREIRINFFRKFAEPLYKEGAEGLIKLATTKEMKQQISESAGTLGIISLKNHLLLNKIFTILAIISVISLALVILFSYRWGRLFSAGFTILIATLPGFLLFLLLNQGLSHDPPPEPPSHESGMSAMLSYVANITLTEPAKDILGHYKIFLIVGIGLIILAILGKVGTSIYYKIKK